MPDDTSELDDEAGRAIDEAITKAVADGTLKRAPPVRGIRDHQPSKFCIEALQEVLDAAKAGKVIAVGICTVDRDDNTQTMHANDSSLSGRRDLVASATLLLHRLVRYWEDS